MARIAVNVTKAAAVNPVNPSLHTVVTTAPGGESAHVYVSFDTAQVTGYQQLHSMIMAALAGLANGNLSANS